jgi:hypothetical protein
MEFIPKIMRPLQNRAEPDSEGEIDFHHNTTEEASGWNDTLDIDRYVKNKDVDGKLRSKIIRKANSLVRLSSIIFKYAIKFEQRDSPSGWTHKARCPFPGHRDSDPSFGYNSKEDRFKCLGCDRTGGIVQFLSGMQQRPQFEIAKQIILSKSSYEEVVNSLDDDDISKIDDALFEFSVKLHNFVKANEYSHLAVEHMEKLTWNLDMYIAQHALNGSIDYDSLKARLEKLLDRLESFGK